MLFLFAQIPFVKYIPLFQNVGVKPNTKHPSHTHTYTRNRREVASRLPSFIHAHTHTHTYQPISIPCLFPILHHHHNHTTFRFSLLFRCVLTTLLFRRSVCPSFSFARHQIRGHIQFSLPYSKPSPTTLLSIHLFRLKAWEWHQPPPPPAPGSGPATRPQPSGPPEHSTDSFLPAQAEPHAP